MSGSSLVEDVFLAALEKNTPADRAAFLDVACKDDPDLRRRVERLLEAHPKAGSFLEFTAPPAGEETASFAPAGEQAGAVIAGRYKLLEAIGEGGMGSVWVAEQTEPVRRKVAVKLIKPGMDSKSVLARFEAERQALAVMDHPNIAKVLDGGLTDAGRPFFVMEYVKGVPITEYCDAARLSVADRLALFVQVCSAVQHAHQKGIIHRDLKPSNILVAPYDDKPVPKVIDFGLAKAMHQALTERTLHTAHETVLGTPLYMSPEQAQLNNLDVDTRSDVYSLGVLLYELLTGTTPLEKQRFKQAAWDEIKRIIREEEPPRPSVRLSSTHTLPSLAAGRQTEPARLKKLMRGELDWIVMKALEKDRNRRYESANGFAVDVQRYLAGEAVQAHPPSAGYRLRKFARKYRAILTTAAAFAGLLIAAATVSSWLAVKARRAESEAEAKRREADENAHRADYNAGQVAGALLAANEMRIDAEQTALGLRVDMDLVEFRQDQRTGLLRLSRTRKEIAEGLDRFKKLNTLRPVDELARDTQDLDQFTTMAVVAAGQQFAPLLPPITHDGQPVVFLRLSPDNQTLLTLSRDNTARLWETRTFKPIAVLRKENEQVLNCGYSPDGKTVFTDDLTSVARFWDVPTGRYRAAIQARKTRHDTPDNLQFNEFRWDGAQIGAKRLLTQRPVVKKSETWTDSSGTHTVSNYRGWEGPVELWDTETGRLVAQLASPDRILQKFQFIYQGRWITTLDDGGSTLLLFSGEDGRLLARLKHPAGDAVHLVDVSPTGRRIATVSGKRSLGSSPPHANNSFSLRVWDAETGQAEPMTIPLGDVSFSSLRFWIDDAPDGLGTVFALENRNALGADLAWMVYRWGQNEPVAELPGGSYWSPLARAGHLAHGGNGQIYDMRTWQRLLPPPGHKFHPDLAKFADGRFVTAFDNAEGSLIDTRTEKSLPILGVLHHLAGVDLVSTLSLSGGFTFGGDVQFLPPPDRLNFPPDLLELWAQVAVRGELNAEGRFVKWGEATWETKRQELAAKPAPYADFPFPGQVATDKFHWLRAEYNEAKTDAAKLRLAEELLRRAEAARDTNEAVYCRAEVERLRQPATAPPKTPTP